MLFVLFNCQCSFHLWSRLCSLSSGYLAHKCFILLLVVVLVLFCYMPVFSSYGFLFVPISNYIIEIIIEFLFFLILLSFCLFFLESMALFNLKVLCGFFYFFCSFFLFYCFFSYLYFHLFLLLWYLFFFFFIYSIFFYSLFVFFSFSFDITFFCFVSFAFFRFWSFCFLFIYMIVLFLFFVFVFLISLV